MGTLTASTPSNTARYKKARQKTIPAPFSYPFSSLAPLRAVPSMHLATVSTLSLARLLPLSCGPNVSNGNGLLYPHYQHAEKEKPPPPDPPEQVICMQAWMWVRVVRSNILI